MSKNVSKTTLNLIYNGQKIEIITLDLQDMDNVTRKHLSKFTFIKYLLNSSGINKYAKEILLKIVDEMPDDYFMGNEYNIFEFVLTLKDNSNGKQLVLPVLFDQQNIDSIAIGNDLKQNDNIMNDVVKLYLSHYNKEKHVAGYCEAIISSNRDYRKSNLKDELSAFEIYSEKKNNDGWLKQDEYDYYKQLEATLRNYNNRNLNVSKFLSSIKSNYYNIRMLCIIQQLYLGKLNDFNTQLVKDGQQYYEQLESSVLNSTEKSKYKG